MSCAERLSLNARVCSLIPFLLLVCGVGVDAYGQATHFDQVEIDA
jgi:hypothetical protein